MYTAVYDDKAGLDDYCMCLQWLFVVWLVIAYLDKVEIAFETRLHLCVCVLMLSTTLYLSFFSSCPGTGSCCCSCRRQR
jgi:hypothetical protein